MSRALDDLSSRFFPKAVMLLARCVEAGIPIMVIDTLRTHEEQQENLRKGVSWIQHSTHEDGDAIDICPYEIFRAEGQDKLLWDGSNPLLEKIGLIGEKCGLVWGGRWKKRDLGHFELKKEE